MSVPQQLVEDVAEFPAEHGVAGQREPGDGSPEGVGAFLVMRAQDAGWRRQGSVSFDVYVHAHRLLLST